MASYQCPPTVRWHCVSACQVGFVDLHAVDMTPLWAEWTEARSTEYAATEAEAVALHGRETFDARRHFYQEIARIYAGGRVGGVRITGRKWGTHEAALLAARARTAFSGPCTPAVRILDSGAHFVRHQQPHQ